MQEIFRVPDVSCGHCKGAIEGALSPLEGVKDASVDIDRKIVSVDYDESRVDRDSVVSAIEGAGYPVGS